MGWGWFACRPREGRGGDFDGRGLVWGCWVLLGLLAVAGAIKLLA